MKRLPAAEITVRLTIPQNERRKLHRSHQNTWLQRSGQLHVASIFSGNAHRLIASSTHNTKKMLPVRFSRSTCKIENISLPFENISLWLIFLVSNAADQGCLPSNCNNGSVTADILRPMFAECAPCCRTEQLVCSVLLTT